MLSLIKHTQCELPKDSSLAIPMRDEWSVSPFYKVLKIVSVTQCFMQLFHTVTIFSFIMQRLTNTPISEPRAQTM